MFARSQIKIYTAILIFLAFLFRMTFVELSSFPSFNSNQSKKMALSHFSNILKKRRECQDVANKASFEVAEEDVLCEESSGNEEDFSKAGVPALLFLFFCGLKPLAVIFGTNRSFDSIKCDLYPKKYLALSVIRI